MLTPGNTWGLSQVIRGFLRPGDHCLVSAMGHNAVMRPLQDLAADIAVFLPVVHRMKQTLLRCLIFVGTVDSPRF